MDVPLLECIYVHDNLSLFNDPFLFFPTPVCINMSVDVSMFRGKHTHMNIVLLQIFGYFQVLSSLFCAFCLLMSTY